MAIDEKDVIDFVSIGQDKKCYLAISDHLDWEKSFEHQALLQAKLNRYVEFVQSGELVERFPETTGCEVVVSIYLFHVPNEAGLTFLSLAERALAAVPISLEYKMSRSVVN